MFIGTESQSRCMFSERRVMYDVKFALCAAVRQLVMNETGARLVFSLNLALLEAV